MKNKLKFLCVVLCLVFISSCADKNGLNQIQLVLKTDKQGNVIKGSKQALIDAIRNGADIKVGWGSKGKTHTIEHLSEPIWLAIMDEKEVVAKLHPQYSATTNWDSLSADHSNSAILHQEWRVVLTTKSSFDAIWYDRKLDTIIKRVPQQHPMSWFSNQTPSLEKPSLLFK
ncbi:MAG: hypothetical protein Mars2KO_19380 [Maribacter sp.]